MKILIQVIKQGEVFGTEWIDKLGSWCHEYGSNDGDVRYGVFSGDGYIRRRYVGYTSKNRLPLFEGDTVELLLMPESLGGNGGATEIEKELSGIIGVDKFGAFIQTFPLELFKDEAKKIYFLELIGLNDESITVTGNIYQNDKYNKL